MSNAEFLRQTYLPSATSRAMGICLGTIAESPDQPLPLANQPLVFRPGQPYLHDTLLRKIIKGKLKPSTGPEAMLARDNALLTHNVLCKEISLSGIAALDGQKDVSLEISKLGVDALHQTIREMGEDEFDAKAWERFMECQSVLARRFTAGVHDRKTQNLLATRYHPTLFVYAALERHVETLVIQETFRL